MGFMSGKFPGHFKMGIHLQSRNILVLLELLHGARSCIKYIPSVGKQRFTCHFNFMNNITLVFRTIHVTIHISLKRQTSVAKGSTDLHTCLQFYSSLNTLSMIFHILLAPNTTMASIVMTVKYKLM